MTFALRSWNVICNILGIFAKNDTLQQFVKLSHAEQRVLLSGLAHHSLENSGANEAKGSIHHSWLYLFQGIRKHFQLPCSYPTRVKRARWIEESFPKDHKLLLLGDDDLLTSEVCQRGFERVVAADCDPAVLKSLREATRNAPHPPLIVHGNFLDRSFMNESGADVICIDPPYNLKWSMVFIEQALRSAGRKPKVTIMLMINPDCFTKDDLNHMWSAFKAQGFALKEQHRRFNSYPLQGLSSFFLRCGIRILLGESIRTAGQGVHFSSDLFVFARDEEGQGECRKIS